MRSRKWFWVVVGVVFFLLFLITLSKQKAVITSLNNTVFKQTNTIKFMGQQIDTLKTNLNIMTIVKDSLRAVLSQTQDDLDVARELIVKKCAIITEKEKSIAQLNIMLSEVRGSSEQKSSKIKDLENRLSDLEINLYRNVKDKDNLSNNLDKLTDRYSDLDAKYFDLSRNYTDTKNKLDQNMVLVCAQAYPFVSAMVSDNDFVELANSMRKYILISPGLENAIWRCKQYNALVRYGYETNMDPNALLNYVVHTNTLSVDNIDVPKLKRSLKSTMNDKLESLLIAYGIPENKARSMTLRIKNSVKL